jgi:hypothetical protein
VVRIEGGGAWIESLQKAAVMAGDEDRGRNLRDGTRDAEGGARIRDERHEGEFTAASGTTT